MKLILLMAMVTLSIQGAQASVQKKSAAKKATASQSAGAPQTQALGPKKKLSKDISFTGAAVDGKYLSAGESIAEVEGDKDMGALIGIRKNFHDRLNDETARLQTARAAAGKGN